MKLQARVQLSLPISNNTIKLIYNTYEKATFDQYLAVSIVKNTKSVKDAYQYVDDITGKGSLNSHLKKLIDKAFELDEAILNKVLNNSIYPITKIDKSNHFRYYECFDISIMNNRIYKGNLKDCSVDQIKEMLLLNYDIIGMDVIHHEISDKPDMYDCKISDSGFEVRINDSWFKLSDEILSDVYVNDLDNIEKYRGNISNYANGEGWAVLTNSVLNNIINPDLKGFYDNEGNHITILNDCLKKTEIIKVFDLYFYKEQRLEFIKENRNICDEALNFLFERNSINEIKTKTILKILVCVEDLMAQRVINYILLRKESKEIALFGLKLIKENIEKNWGKDTLLSIKKFCEPNDLKYVYKIDSDLNFSDTDLLNIDNDLLLESDYLRKKQYLEKTENLKTEIRSIIGSITSSGIRERMKKLKSNDLTKKVTKKLNKMVGHKKANIEDYTQQQLRKYLVEVQELLDECNELEKQLKKFK